MTLHLVPFDVDSNDVTGCFINPDNITSINILRARGENEDSDKYYLIVETIYKNWCSRGFKTEADAEKLMNEFIAECYAEHGCENCSDYYCGARNEL